jgi:hypothetical protein
VAQLRLFLPTEARLAAYALRWVHMRLAEKSRLDLERGGGNAEARRRNLILAFGGSES